MDIKVIRTRSEYEEALNSFSKLMDKDPAPGSKDENALELLVLVIKDYEQRVGEPIVVDPIEAIRFRMDQMEFSRQDLIPFLGSISRVSEILSGKRNLSLSMIRKLHSGLGIPLESLVSRRTVYRKRARRTQKRKKIPVLRTRKRTC
jgi:HTH-type transcriptional regulator/antitoxin HigA